MGPASDKRLRRLRRAPTLHFALLGALLFLAHVWWAAALRPLATPPHIGPAADVEDELLFREALARGFDRGDRVVRTRLVSLARYLGLAAADDEAALEREARRLGLERSDLAVHRHLVEMMRLAIAQSDAADVPDEAALHAYYDAHAERFTAPPRLTLTQVYLSRARRGDALATDAAAVLATLRTRRVAPEAAAALGDPFVRGARLQLASASTLERRFGPAFVAALEALPERSWSDPLPSPYGVHLVFVEAREPARPIPFEVVRGRVLHELLRARGEQRLRTELQALRVRYAVGDQG